MKGVYPLLVLCLSSFYVFAQEEREEPPAGNNPVIRIQEQRLFGKVIDGRTSQGLAAATVQLYALLPNGKDSLVSSQFTRSNGDFSFNKLPQTDSLEVRISGIGYKSWKRIITSTNGRSMTTDLGNITLDQEVTTLGAVVVTAQRPALQMGIDRKTFNVERNLTAAGGTALDVMRNIPSVSVDVEGNVQLRNAEPQLFVDGRPTILTPDQIPADQIERIELITNPSARFDAASSGGIINIIMKRNRRVGLNGVATIGAGHPSIYNGNLTLNVRQGKLNFFTSGSYNQSGGEAKGRTLRQNKVNGLVNNYFNQYALNDFRRRFSSLRFGLDFFATNRTTLSITQNIANGNFRNDETQDQEYLNSSKQLERYGYRTSDGRNAFKRYNTQLNFTHKFPQQGKELTANINYNYGNGNDRSTILNSFFFPNGTLYGAPSQVRNEGRNNNDQYTFQVDYVSPYDENSKLELGARSNINEQHSLFSSFSIANGQDTRLPLGNNYMYREVVNAIYGSWSNKIKTFSYQAGLRAEVSSFEGNLLDSAKQFGYDYPNSARRFFDALFPSLFLTKEVGDNIQLQVNYTRRIRRPNFWQLNPFIDINDPVNLR
ncbi:MAG TPA: TonB-dependent receptor, partial [Flavisolibacter sp.]|nr:TonB-dependent receptor [Flavisolibacter sp.]